MDDQASDCTPNFKFRVGDHVRLNILSECQPPTHTRMIRMQSGDMAYAMSSGVDAFGHLPEYNGRTGRIRDIHWVTTGHPVVVDHDDFPGISSSVSESEIEHVLNDEPPADHSAGGLDEQPSKGHRHVTRCE